MAEITPEEAVARAREIIKNQTPIVPDRDIKPLVDILNQAIYEENKIMARKDEMEEDMPTEDMPKEEEMPGAGPEDAEMPEEGTDMSPLMEMLGIDETKARALFDAAKQLPDVADLTPEQLAELLVEDFQMRMRLEELAAGTADMAAEEAMDDMGMMAPPMAPPGAPMAGEAGGMGGGMGGGMPPGGSY